MIAWFKRNRTSVRVAFLLRLFVMAAGALLSLLWYRLLLRAMGDSLYGLFLAFQSVARLGGLGDFGISGAISVKGGMMLGRGEDENLRKLLAAARTLFLLLASLVFIVFAVLSPWLPHWLGFRGVPGAGSLPVLFFWGGVTGAVCILAGYFASLNYAHGTVTWPILPAMFIGQLLAPLLHWQLARLAVPLWVQQLPYLGASALIGWLAWRMLKWSHPWLGNLRPLIVDRAFWKILLVTSGWAYLSGLSSVLYHNTDRLVINAGFGPAALPAYQANYTATALAVTLALSASFVGLPKITQWISSPHAADRQRLLMEMNRLNIFQILLGCCAAFGYLALNDFFVRYWLGANYQGSSALQLAFACNLAVTVGGDTGIQIASRCGDSGLKKVGLAGGGTGLLNLALSLVAMRFGSLTGVAVATIIAQSILSLSMGWVTCRYLGLSAFRWTLKSWLLPLVIVLAAGGLKMCLSGQSFFHIGVLLGCYAGLLLVVVLLVGMNREMLRSELATIRAMLKV